jgi:hypothetical protein
MDQQRRNNFYFFQNCSADSSRPMAFIPYENLGTLELGGQTGNVGKEIYGAGECLWLYLMFEALGLAGDRELLLVNLDLLDVRDSAHFPPQPLHFTLYNPTDAVRNASISIPSAQAKKVRITVEGKETKASIAVPSHGIMQLTVEY